MTRSPLVPGKDLDFSAATAATATCDRDDEADKELGSELNRRRSNRLAADELVSRQSTAAHVAEVEVDRL